MPKEFAHFCSAICTRSEPITYEQLSIMLQSKEQATAENLDNLPHSLAMFASSNKHSNNPQPQSYNDGGSNKGRGKKNRNRGKGGGRYNNNGGGSQQQFFTPQPQQNYSSVHTTQFGG